MRGLAIRLGIVAVILIGGFVFRSYLSGNASDLQVGDCFDVPTDQSQTINDVQHHPCTDSHTGEVVFVGNMDSATYSSYPTEDQFQQFVQDNCLVAYTAYTGADVLTTQGADMGFFAPTEDGWTKHNDREVTCYATRQDGAATTGTLKKH